MMNKPERALFSATNEEVEKFLVRLSAQLREREIDRSICFKVELALEEVLINLVKHAYRAGNAAGEIEVLYNLSAPDSLSFVIKDQGEPFNPLDYQPAPFLHLPLEERREGGLGIILIKNSMDQCRYERLEPFNILTLEKRL